MDTPLQFNSEQMAEFITTECTKSNITDEDKIFKIYKWAIQTQVDAILLDSLFKGILNIKDFTEEGLSCSPSEVLQSEYPELQNLNTPIWDEISKIIEEKQNGNE
jgi:hypothetical protein